jgi:hypothetical protein
MLNILHYTLQGLICLVEIVGIIGGVIAISRRKKLLGTLAIAGFLLLGLNLLVNIGLEQFRTYAARNFIDILWISPCVAAPLAFLGVVCLVIAVFSATPSKMTNLEEPPRE